MTKAEQLAQEKYPFEMQYDDRAAYIAGYNEDKWIRVSEILPEDQTDVLICHINSAGKHVSQSLYKGSKFYYTAETNHGYYEEVFSVVTHWQPLPSLPKTDL